MVNEDPLLTNDYEQLYECEISGEQLKYDKTHKTNKWYKNLKIWKGIVALFNKLTPSFRK
tara:strand:- start:330 stop:509 length:180 start_codon:yes stop_codon:yes gene_type:complete